LKKYIISSLICICSFFGTSLNAHAFAPKQLPIVQQSDHWKVMIKEPSEKKRAKAGVYDVFNFSVINTGAWAYNVTVDIFRDEPKTITNYGLFKMENEKVGRNSFHLDTYPVSVKANTIKVLVTWQDQPLSNEIKYSRKYMQEFTFKVQ